MQPEGREIEFKFGVAGTDAFVRLVRHLNLPESALENGITQTNHFFDSASHCLHARHFVIRLREYDGARLLTIKGEQQSGASGSGVLTDRVQEEVAIPEDAADDLLHGRASPRKVISELFRNRSAGILRLIDEACHDRELVPIGAFSNERIHLPPVSLTTENGIQNVEFELDASTFPGGRIDCEIEVEIPAHSDAVVIESALIDLLEQAGIEWHPAASKAQRFFEALETSDAR